MNRTLDKQKASPAEKPPRAVRCQPHPYATDFDSFSFDSGWQWPRGDGPEPLRLGGAVRSVG